MNIGILTEQNDTRVALIPETIQKLVADGNQAWVARMAGAKAFYSDADFEAAGAKVTSTEEVLGAADLLVSIHPPTDEILGKLKGKALVSSFQPFADPAVKEKLAGFGLTAFSLDMIPRTTLAQAMDVLSSMASISGYKAVLAAAALLPRYFPMLTTAAGSIPPAKVLILGAGVAGLQAIATAKRLGSVVEAFDTRLAAKEEVESLGAKFVMVEGAKDDKAAGGYAVEQSEEYKQRQRELIHDKASKADVIITTAQLRGKPAPLLVTKATVESMKAGSVIVDLAASSGGNCEVTQDGKTILHNGVYVVGNSNFAAEMPQHASQLYSRNILNFMKTFLNKGEMNINLENEILKSACIVLNGQSR